MFVDEVYDIIGPYLARPEAAVVLSVEGLSLGPGNWPGHNRAFPMMPGLAEERTHDRVRYGTTSLFAAIDTSDCTVTFSLLADRTAPSTSANS